MTILEQLQSAFPDVEGIGDARNIAEALAMISGAGGRGANAIADKVSNPGGSGGDDEYNVFYLIAMGGMSAIGSAIQSCTKLDLKVPYIISSIFSGFPALETAIFPNASYIGNSAFYSCSNLTSVSFPNATEIGDNAFMYCSSLTSVTFPNVSYIGVGAFGSCNLTSVSFPNIVQIGQYAFAHCQKLIGLYLTGGNITQVPRLAGESCFVGSPIGGYSDVAGQYGSVYVPASLYESFLSADNWSSIASRIVSVPES